MVLTANERIVGILVHLWQVAVITAVISETGDVTSSRVKLQMREMLLLWAYMVSCSDQCITATGCSDHISDCQCHSSRIKLEMRKLCHTFVLMQLVAVMQWSLQHCNGNESGIHKQSGFIWLLEWCSEFEPIWQVAVIITVIGDVTSSRIKLQMRELFILLC